MQSFFLDEQVSSVLFSKLYPAELMWSYQQPFVMKVGKLELLEQVE
jgi:hypothetical protein